MRNPTKEWALCILCVFVSLWLAYVIGSAQSAGTWPQWRGPARDGVAPAKAPAAWPVTLTKKWKIRSAADTRRRSSRMAGSTCTRGTASKRRLPHSTSRQASPCGRRACGAYKVNPPPRPTGQVPSRRPVLANGRLYTFGISGILSCLRRHKRQGDLAQAAVGRAAPLRRRDVAYRRRRPAGGLRRRPRAWRADSI